MVRVVLAQLRYAFGRTAALAVVIALATASFTVLTRVVEADRLQVRGTVTENFRSSYDLLVRPSSSFTPREVEQGLVRPNYQSGIFGGITPGQLDEIRGVQGVEVAAPVSNLGYVNVVGSVRINLRPLLDSDARQQLLRIRPTFTMDRGLTRFDGAPVLVYVSRNPAVLTKGAGNTVGVDAEDTDAYVERVPGRAAPLPACVNYQLDALDELRSRDPSYDKGEHPPMPWGYRDPYLETATALRCYYLPTTPKDVRDFGASDPSRLEAVTPVSLPVLLTAIDPEAEEKISGLREAVVSGRPLSREDGPPPAMDQSNSQLTDVPVLAATTTTIDQQVTASVERLKAHDAELTRVLSRPRGLITRLGSLPADRLSDAVTGSAQEAWDQVASGQTAREQGSEVPIGSYWQVGASRYHQDGGALVVEREANPQSEYVSSGLSQPAPVGSDDSGFRPVTGRSLFAGGQRYGQLKVVGRFDASRVLADQALSGLLSPTYVSPLLPGADARSRSALHDEPLAPSSNVAGYAAQPPALLTTLPAARFLLNSGSYTAAGYYSEELPQGADRPDPISVVRVRVAGITGPDPVSRERLNQAALAIQQRTGLAVDIVAGSSGVPTTVVLPGGDHGRPELRLQESWARKGLAYVVVSAIDRKSLALFVLILTVCALVVGNASSAAVRTRRTSLGVLSCIGWGKARLLGVLVAELATIGLVAGVIGAGLALLVGAAGGPVVSAAGSLLAVPPAVLLAVSAGLVPAVRAARAAPMDAVRPLVRTPRRTTPVGTITRLGLRGLGRTPGRTVLASASVALGVAATAVLLTVHEAFRGLLVGSLLGDAVVLQVRGPDLVALGAIVALGVIAVVDVVHLGVREQSTELAMLRSTGWTEAALVRLVATQGVGVGVLGSCTGALAGVLAMLGLTGSMQVGVLGPVLVAVVAGIVLAGLAALGPALLVRRAATASLLSREDS